MPVKAAEWEGAFRALNLPNLLEDERFSTLDARLENMPVWQEIINSAYAVFTTGEICARLEAEDVPYSHINDRHEVPGDPQIEAMDALLSFRASAGWSDATAAPGRPVSWHAIESAAGITGNG